MKKIITVLLVFVCLSVTAHEFWLNPFKFIFQKGEKANIRFFVGENFEGENWAGNHTKISFLTLYTNNGKTDLAPLISNKNGDSLQLTMKEEGTAMVVYNGLNSFIELEAAKFNAYLEEDGLREAIEYRKQHHETDSMSHEFYQRSVKTILQVGNRYDSFFKQPSTLPLDIIPLEHPYSIRDRQKMVVKVLFNNKPLADQLIKMWYRENNNTIKEDLLTDQNGLVSFKIRKSGRWMVSTVKMVHLENNPKANWQSYWGSCTWGYE